MPAEQRFPTMAPRTVTLDGGRFTVAAPRWAEWQAALDRAAPGGRPDAQRLVEECLLTCVRRAEDGRPVDPADLRALAARDGDALLSAVLELIDGQRQALDLQVREQADGVEIRGTGVCLRLRAWSFGERNDALRRSLRLEGGQVLLDLSAHEQAMIRRCVSTLPATVGGVDEAGSADASGWPVPLGEVVMRELDRMNGVEPAYAATLAACIRTGQEHPDLALIQLCQTFGWTPEQAEQMAARTGQRLVAALQVVQGTGAAAFQAGAPSQGGEGVTRIIVQDD